MAGNSGNKGFGKVIDSESDLTVENAIKTVYNSTVKIRSQLQGQIILTGQVTGKQYVWQNSGQVVEVDSQDAPFLAGKRLGRSSCCGGYQQGFPVFVIEN